MKKDPRVYLAQILERIDRIVEYTVSGKDAFFADARTQDAVIRNFEVIGEAAKRLDSAFQEQHPGIPWRSIAGFRDVLIHQYEGVSLVAVWEIVERDLPSIRRALIQLLPPLDALEREITGDDGSGDT